jgi:hypothetical protein
MPPRIDRFKFTKKKHIADSLMRDSEIALAVHEHARAHQLSEAAVWGTVRTYAAMETLR